MGSQDDGAGTLPGGLVLRAAAAADVEAVTELNRLVHGGEHEAIVRALLDDPRVGPERFTVVTDGDRVVSSLCLMAEVLRVEDVTLPVGQVEYVSTLPDYRRRGLVRAQFEMVHRWSSARGDLLQMVLGIPALYRRFGYDYVIDLPAMRLLGWGVNPSMPPGWQAREATPEDIPALRRLHEAAQAAVPVARLRTDRDWEVLVGTGENAHEQAWVVGVGGRVRGSGRLQQEDDRWLLLEPAADSRDAARALLSAVAERVPASGLAIADRPGTPVASLLADLTVPLDDFAWAAYIRVADPVALLNGLRTVLSARLKASVFAEERGELLLSTYTGGILLSYEQGQVTGVRVTEGLEEPGPQQVGVPTDLLGMLLLGRYGAGGLARRYRQDVALNQRRSLMEVLFPRLQADIWPAY